MKRKGGFILLAILVATLGTVGLYAQTTTRETRDWHRGQAGVLQHLTRVYNLTDAQQTQIKAMWETEKPNVLPLLQQLAQGQKEMQAATANGSFDEAKVNQIAQQQSQTITSLLVEKQRLESKFYQILTPEQRTKFTQRQERRQGHFDRLLQQLAQ